MQSEKKCVCCESRFGANGKYPTKMDCGHFVCMTCILLKKSENQDAQDIPCVCPKCQTTTNFDKTIIEVQLAMLNYNQPQDN